MAILAFLSDIPLYFQALLEKLTGEDMSAISGTFSDIFSSALDAAEKIANLIG
ncbi:MAG: hypothetical protein IJC37_00215 [Clostridia bacterium]|nr:hypothetical protein [Clostridia bacterium]